MDQSENKFSFVPAGEGHKAFQPVKAALLNLVPKQEEIEYAIFTDGSYPLPTAIFKKGFSDLAKHGEKILRFAARALENILTTSFPGLTLAVDGTPVDPGTHLLSLLAENATTGNAYALVCDVTGVFKNDGT